LADSPSLPIIPKAAEWVLGPANASLGTLADIQVPEGKSEYEEKTKEDTKQKKKPPNQSAFPN